MLAREKWQIEAIRTLEKVFEERVRQVARYGHNDELADGTGPEVMWCPWGAPLTALDLERVFRADYEAYELENGEPTWMHLVREELAEAFAESNPDRLEEELIQVAALCVSWVETLQKRKEVL